MREINGRSGKNDDDGNDGKLTKGNCLEYASSSKKGVSFVSFKEDSLFYN